MQWVLTPMKIGEIWVLTRFVLMFKDGYCEDYGTRVRSLALPIGANTRKYNPVDKVIQSPTDIEIQVIQAAADGRTLDETAEHLGLTRADARLHRYRALRKTGAADMCVLVKTSIYEGWIPVPEGIIIMPPEDDLSPNRSTSDSGESGELGVGCPLSTRQLEVTRALATGLSITEIAEILNLSNVTIRNHIQRARDAAQAPNKIGLVATAIAEGWIAPPPTRFMGMVSIDTSGRESVQLRYIAVG